MTCFGGQLCYRWLSWEWLTHFVNVYFSASTAAAVTAWECKQQQGHNQWVPGVLSATNNITHRDPTDIYRQRPTQVHVHFFILFLKGMLNNVNWMTHSSLLWNMLHFLCDLREVYLVACQNVLWYVAYCSVTFSALGNRIQVRRLIKESAVYEKRSTYRRCCWYVHADVLARHSQEALTVPCQWTYLTSGAQITREEPAGSQGNSPTPQSTSTTPSNKRKSASSHSITKYMKKCGESEQVWETQDFTCYDLECLFSINCKLGFGCF